MKRSSDSTDDKPGRIAWLIEGFVHQTLSPEEHDELNAWVEESEENLSLFQRLTDDDSLEKAMKELGSIDPNKYLPGKSNETSFRQRPAIFTLWPYAAAATLILALAATWFFRDTEPQRPSPATARAPQHISPATGTALLTLSNGRAVVLDANNAGTSITDRSVQISIGKDRTLLYNQQSNSPDNSMNTLRTAKGSQYKITLSDGTHIWLNAETTLSYPLTFAGSQRVVELTGEASFEVAPDPAKPFYVRSARQQVTVIGTRFNINAYNNNENTTTTLLEGRIALHSKHSRVTMTPGEQYLLTATGTLQRIPNPDLESATAWTRGRFRFHDESLNNIMKEISRWYNVQVIFEEKIDAHFNGEMSRSLPVSRVLQLLEKTGAVHFTLDGNKIIVRQ